MHAGRLAADAIVAAHRINFPDRREGLVQTFQVIRFQLGNAQGIAMSAPKPFRRAIGGTLFGTFGRVPKQRAVLRQTRGRRGQRRAQLAMQGRDALLESQAGQRIHAQNSPPGAVGIRYGDMLGEPVLPLDGPQIAFHQSSTALADGFHRAQCRER